MSTKLTPTQRDALDDIREARHRCVYLKKPDRYEADVRRGRYSAEFNIRTVRAFEKRGLVEMVAVADDGYTVDYYVRITDAGRVALGDWAAAERSGEESA